MVIDASKYEKLKNPIKTGLNEIKETPELLLTQAEFGIPFNKTMSHSRKLLKTYIFSEEEIKK